VNILRRILLIILSIVVLSGCNKDSSLSVSEVSQKNISKDIQSFFQEVKEENGVYLYFDEQKSNVFVYLNGSNVSQDDMAVHFTGFDVEKENETLNLLYKSEETSDYSNPSLENELFYKVNLADDYDVVKVFNNGNETIFNTISGNN